VNWRRFGVWLVAWSCLAKTAAAHAPPLANGIQWFTDAEGGRPRALVRTNRGLIIEGAASGTFGIVCNDAFQASLVEVPPVVVAPDGSLLLGTYLGGLVRSSPDRCSFESVTGAFDGLYPIDVKANQAGTVYAAVLPFDGSSAELLESSDLGRTATALTQLPGAPTDLEVAPSDSSRLYLSVTVAEGNLSFGRLLTSADAGRSFAEHAIELDASELRVFVLAVAPQQPRLLFVRTQSRDGITPERLLRSEDGGETFQTVLSAPGPISAVVQADGTVWAGTAEGMYRSNDNGVSFTRIDASDLTRITCLATHGDAVYACAYSAGEFGVLVSESGADAFQWFLRFPQVTTRLDCPMDSDEGSRCAGAFADWSNEQGLLPAAMGGAGAAATPPSAGAAATPPSAGARASDSGCQLAPGLPVSPSSALLGALFGLAAVRGCRRRRATAVSDER
jgi:hypothetical protein